MAQPSDAVRDGPADAELIARYRDGHDEAASTLLARHERALRRYLAATAPQRVDELAADATSRACAALRRGEGPSEAFRPFLVAIARDLAGPAPAPDPEDGPAPDPAALATACAALPERWQAVLWHTDLDGEDDRALGVLLGLPAVDVPALRHRARDGLRREYVAARSAPDASRDSTPGAGPACAAAREQLAAYVDRRTRTDVELETHLEQCRVCGGTYLELRALVASPGPALAAALLGTVPVARTPLPAPAPRASRWLIPAAAAAAVLVVVAMVVGIVAATTGQAPAEPDPEPVAPGTALRPTPTPVTSPSPSASPSREPRRQRPRRSPSRSPGGSPTDAATAPATSPAAPVVPPEPGPTSETTRPTTRPTTAPTPAPTPRPSTGPTPPAPPSSPPSAPPTNPPTTTPTAPPTTPPPSTPPPPPTTPAPDPSDAPPSPTP